MLNIQILLNLFNKKNMKIINLLLLLLQIFLETYLISKSSFSFYFINPKFFLLMKYILNAFLITKELRKNSQRNFYIFIFMTLDALIGKYLINIYYPDRPQFDIPLILFTYYLAGFSLSFIKSSDFEEFENSEINSAITKFICSFVFSNVFYNYLMNYHLNTAKNFLITFEFIYYYLELFLADFLIIFGVGCYSNLINFFYEDNKGIKKILIKFLFKMINMFLFFAIFNSAFAEFFYEILFSYISKPNNILIYNCFAYDNEIRMKIIFGIFYNILF
jgi:hypothetical protein